MACKHCETVPGSGESMFPYYGMAPHTHAMGRTGSLIGSTVLSPRAEWPENFEPDPEDPWAGVWTHCLHCGAGKKVQDD